MFETELRSCEEEQKAQWAKKGFGDESEDMMKQGKMSKHSGQSEGVYINVEDPDHFFMVKVASWVITYCFEPCKLL